MKKFFALLTVLALILAAGCGSDDEYKVGVIRHLNASEEALDKFYDKLEDDSHEKHRHIFFNSMTEMTEALKSGQIDEIVTYEVVGKYLVARNWDFDVAVDKAGLSDAFCCAFREKNVALKKEFSDAIDDIIADGTLKNLVKVYIFADSYSEVSTKVEMPIFHHDEYDDDYELPIKIGVTGDLPPLDFVAADGKPSGFNTALLAEISRRLKKNFVLVPIDGGARALALTSGQVDVVFWVIVPTYDDVPLDIDKPAGIILTDPYFTDEIVHVRLKK